MPAQAFIPGIWRKLKVKFLSSRSSKFYTQCNRRRPDQAIAKRDDMNCLGAAYLLKPEICFDEFDGSATINGGNLHLLKCRIDLLFFESSTPFPSANLYTDLRW